MSCVVTEGFKQNEKTFVAQLDIHEMLGMQACWWQ